MPSCWTNLLLCRKSRKTMRRSTTTVGIQTEAAKAMPEQGLPSVRFTTGRVSMAGNSVSSLGFSKKPPQAVASAPANELLSFNSGSFSSISKNSSVHFFKPERQCPSVLVGWSNFESPVERSRRSGIVWPNSAVNDPFIFAQNTPWPRLKPVTPAGKARSLVRTRSRPAAFQESL